MLFFYKMKFEGFNWDEGNINKCRKHGLSKSEIECFFLQEKVHLAPDIKHSDFETRFLAIGKGPKGKLMIVAFTFRNWNEKNLIRPISARFMNKKETQKYEKEFKTNENR